jgi:hypothetical protein
LGEVLTLSHAEEALNRRSKKQVLNYTEIMMIEHLRAKNPPRSSPSFTCHRHENSEQESNQKNLFRSSSSIHPKMLVCVKGNDDDERIKKKKQHIIKGEAKSV